MTGFATISVESDVARVDLTVKSVNHRFLDVVVKAPHALASVEGGVKAAAQRRLTRGRVEISVAFDDVTRGEREVVLDEQLLARFVEALDGARARGIVTGALTASDIVRLPHVFELRDRPVDLSPLAAVVESGMPALLDRLVEMREAEGRLLAADLDARLRTLEVFVNAVTEASRLADEALAVRLRERLAALPSDLALDGAALAQEVVRFVARSDIAEELVRLTAHIEHWRLLASGPEPCGRKLDFLVQEMNREINTIGSKAEGMRASELVIGAKAELERVREQVQNVE